MSKKKSKEESKSTLVDSSRPERAENFVISLVVNGSVLSSDDMEHINEAFGHIQMGEDDTLSLKYKFDIMYFGNVVSRLSLIISLLDKTCIKEVSTDEIKFSKSVIQELLCRLEELEGKFSGPKGGDAK